MSARKKNPKEQGQDAMAPEADGPMFTVVKACLEDLKWSYEVSEKDDDRVVITTRVRLEDLTCRTQFVLSESRQRLGIFVYLPFAVPEDRRMAVMEYLTRVNYRIFLAKFEFDLSDGELRAVCAVITEDATLSLEMVQRMRRDAHGVMETYAPGILSIVYGHRTAQDAWQSLLDREAEEQASVAGETPAGHEGEVATE